MRCRRARRFLVERDLGLLSGRARAALDAHLTGCVDCVAHATADAALTADLLSLRVDTPFEIDVRDRVVADLPATLPTGLGELRTQPFGWAVAGAIASAVALVWGLWELTSTLPALAQYAGSLFQGAKPLVASSLATLATFATAVGQLLANLLGAAAPVFRSLQPVATTAILASFVMMSCTIALVVARDLRKPHPIHEDCR